MKIITHETNIQAKAAVDFYKSFIKISDLYENSPKCEEHSSFKVVLDFDNEGNERGLVVRKEKQ